MTATPHKTARELSSVRDMIESIWIAIVLAFVLRAFMIEAFAIPTGSMAPRLMGEHWQLICPSCGYEYAYGLGRSAQMSSAFSRKVRHQPVGATCPNCRYPFRGRPDFTRGGDRVLVLKYLYRFREPEPWDVVVFRNPQNNRENYIKRLIGLPGETIEIVHGDIFVRGDGQWKIRRKPQRAQQAMWQVVFDNDYRPDMKLIEGINRQRSLEQRITPARWEPGRGGAKWDLSGVDGRRFAFRGSREPAEIAFHAARDAFLPHYGYNRPREDAERVGDNDICSDLKLSFVLVPNGADLEVGLSLDSFAHRFEGRLRSDGTVTLLHDPPDEIRGNWVEWGQAKIQPLRIGESCQVALTHVDYRVTLWVNGRPVLASSDQQYSPNYQEIKARLSEAASRSMPIPQVKVWAVGGPCDLLHVKLYRDAFYTRAKLSKIQSGPLGEYARKLPISGDSRGWGTMGRPITLGEDQFFVLGDNSPQSLDGRAWTAAAPTLRLWQKEGKILKCYAPGAEPAYQLGTVPRYALIGKAFFVYWPGAFRVPGLPGLPILPNVGRMRLIR